MQLFHLTESAVNQIAKAVQVLTWNKMIWVWFEAIWKKEIDMEVLGLSLFPFKKNGRYVDPASRIDITECHSRLRWLQNYDIPCSPLRDKLKFGNKSWRVKIQTGSATKSTDRSFTSFQMVHTHTQRDSAHLSHTTLSPTIFHTRLCHTPSLTHPLSHTIFFTLEQSARHIALFPPLKYFLLMFWLSRQWVLLGAFT